MTTQNTEIAAIRTMRARLEEAAAIVRAAEGCAADGQPGMALDVEPLAVEANRLLQGLAILSTSIQWIQGAKASPYQRTAGRSRWQFPLDNATADR